MQKSHARRSHVSSMSEATSVGGQVGSGGGGGGGAVSNGKGRKGGLATPSVRDCANCGAPEGSIPGSPTHSACSKCKITYYCSTKCQKQHWKTGGHKQHCKCPSERTVANAMRGAGAAEALATALPRRAKRSARASTVFKSSPDYRCPICLDTTEGCGLVEKLSCSHEYHFECLRDAQKSMGSSFWEKGCGLCRSPYGDVVAVSDQFNATMGVAMNIITDNKDETILKRWGHHLKHKQESAVEALRGFSQQGHRLSKLLLGTLLLEGARFIELCEAEGQLLLREAAGDGCAGAAETLAGHLVESSETFEEGIDILRDLAELGRQTCQYQLAKLLANVNSACLIPCYVDYAEAIYWYTRVVVDHGQHDVVAASAFNITILLDGKHPGVPVDMALKRRMQDIAADLMHASAMMNKSNAVLHGEDGRERDPLAAYQLVKRLATAPENEDISEADRLEGMVKCGQVWNISRQEGWLALLPGIEDEAVEFVRRAVLESTGLHGDCLKLGQMTLLDFAANGKGRYRKADTMEEIMPVAEALTSTSGFGDGYIGERVELRGLSSKKHRKLKLNGCRGVVVEADFSALPPMFRVKLDDGRGPFSIPFESVSGKWDIKK